MPGSELFYKRRRALQQSLPADSLLILASAGKAVYSNDIHYRFRQHADFYFLTGFAEDNCLLLLFPDKSIIYLQDTDPDETIWSGARLGINKAPEHLQFDEARNIDDFNSDLPAIFKGRSRLYHSFGQDLELDGELLGQLHELNAARRKGSSYPLEIVHASALLHELRKIKAPEEIAIIQECIAITGEAHIACMQESKPGMHEYELEALLLYHFHKAGACEAYPSIVASGPEACILHYIENKRVMNQEDLVLIDAGASRRYFNADISRTFPAGRKFSPATRDLYGIVLEAQKVALSKTKAGVTMDEIHEAACRVLTQGLMDLGILCELSLDDHMKEETYLAYYPHRTGHYLGLDVHDAGDYYDREHRALPLLENMLITMEPGLYIPEKFSVPGRLQKKAERLKKYIRHPEAFKGTGIRIEDNVLIQASDCLNLSSAIPKELDELEALKS